MQFSEDWLTDIIERVKASALSSVSLFQELIVKIPNGNP
jgi:hypothetical protein